MKMIYWAVVITFAALVIVTGCLALGSKPAYDERGHRAEIERIFPSVNWPEYREAMREVCQDSEAAFAHVRDLAAEDGADQLRGLTISVRYMCPERAQNG